MAAWICWRRVRGRCGRCGGGCRLCFRIRYAALNPRMRVREILAEPFAIHQERPAEGLTATACGDVAEVGLDGVGAGAVSA